MNRFKMEMEALSENEGFARVCVAAFVTRLDPTLEEINDVKTAVSEAVTNSVIHGYGGNGGKIIIECSVENNTMEVMIKDFGKGIADVEKAMEPMYTPMRCMNAQAWDLHLWKCLWMNFRWCLKKVEAQP